MSSGSGIKSGMFANSGTGQGIANTSNANANGLYGTLNPTLTAEATNPQGINPADLAKMNTSAQQSSGGSNAGAVGQGSLLSARTRNAGTADAAVAKSAEGAGQTLGNAAVGIQNANTQAKLKQQQQGLGGLGSLYGSNQSAAIGGLDASTSALKGASQVPNFWQQYLLNAQKNAQSTAAMGAGG